MTPSAVSKYVKRIERSTGRVLFDRNYDGMRPNDEGLAFVAYAERFLALAQEVGHRFGRDLTTGTVRLGITDDVGLACIPDVLRTCKIAHPHVSIELVVDFTSDLIKAADARLVDLAILSDGSPQFPSSAMPLASERLVWAKKPGLVVDGSAVPLVLAKEGCNWRARALDALAAAGLKHQVACTSPSTAGQISGVQFGLGIAPIPESVVKDVPGISIDETQLPNLAESQLALYQTAPDGPVVNSVRDAITGIFDCETSIELSA